MAGRVTWCRYGVCKFVILSRKNLLDALENGWYTFLVKFLKQGAVAKW